MIGRRPVCRTSGIVSTAVRRSTSRDGRNTPLLLQADVSGTRVSFRRLTGFPGHELNPLPGVFFLGFRGSLSWGGEFSQDAGVSPASTIHGGISISPEFTRYSSELSTCTTAFSSRRSSACGSSAVGNRGKRGAAGVVGILCAAPLAHRLSAGAAAYRPPTTSQFLNLVKNSSLGRAIATPIAVDHGARRAGTSTGQGEVEKRFRARGDRLT